MRGASTTAVLAVLAVLAALAVLATATTAVPAFAADSDGRRARILEDANGRRRLEVPLDRRPRSDDRRLLRGLDDTEKKFKELAQISREKDGVYWSWLHIGPNEDDVFSVIVDTGSSTIAVPCAGCNCGDHNHFDPSQSNGAKYLSNYKQCYSEGSCNSGKNVEALMCLGKACDVATEGIVHSFGCCSSYATPFKHQFADGIIGMFGGNSHTLIGSLRQAHRLEDDLFSMCLASRTGVLGVGGYDETRHLEPIQWIPLSSVGFYKVGVQKFYVEGEAVQLGQSLKKPIVDSGTTFTYVDSHTADALSNSFKTFCAKDGNCPGTANPTSAHPDDRRDSIMCYAPPEGEDYSEDLDPWLEKFPTLELEFEAYEGTSARICIPPGAYFFRSRGAYCVGILRDARGSFVLGALTMGGFDYVFDHGKNRLGIARSICDQTRDNEPGTRSSRAECCGSCAVAQKNGFNLPNPVPAPTPEPTVAATTTTTSSVPESHVPSPTPEMRNTQPPEGTKTADGLFIISYDAERFGNKTVLEPEYDSAWSVTAYTFLPDQVLRLTRSANICEKEDASAAWVFSPQGLVVIEGEDAVVTVGANCALPNVQVEQGATLRTKRGPAGSVSDDDDDETPTYRIRIDGVLDLRQGHLVVSEASTLVFSSQSRGLEMDSGSRVVLERTAGLQCVNLSHDRRLELAAGVLDVNAGVVVSCYTFIGPDATMTVQPDPEEIENPAVFLGKLEVAGTLTMIVKRSPMQTFAMRIGDTISWALAHYKPKLRIVEADEGHESTMLFRDVPEKARMYSVRKTIEDKPAIVEFSDVFHCAKVELEDGYSQLTFPTETCLNRCLDDHDLECPPEEQEFYPWPPEAEDGSSTIQGEDLDGDDDEDDKEQPWFDLSPYEDYVGKSVQDPNVQKSAAGGAFFGIFMAFVVFCVAHPPACLAETCRWCRCCCCCFRSRGDNRGPRHQYDNI